MHFQVFKGPEVIWHNRKNDFLLTFFTLTCFLCLLSVQRSAANSYFTVCYFTIGEGQFGKVYACVNLDTGELMAVKQV